MVEVQPLPVAPLHQGLLPQEIRLGRQGQGAWRIIAAPSELVEEHQGLVRQAPEEEQRPGSQDPHVPGQVDPDQPLLLQK